MIEHNRGAIISAIREDTRAYSVADQAAVDWSLIRAERAASWDANDLSLCRKAIADVFKPGVFPQERIEGRWAQLAERAPKILYLLNLRHVVLEIMGLHG